MSNDGPIEYLGKRIEVEDLPAPYRPPVVRDRAGIYAEVEAAWEELDSFVATLQVTDFDRTVPGLGEGADSWTIKDVIAHLAAWRRNGARVAALQAEAGALPVNAFPGSLLGVKTHEFNARLLTDWRKRPLEDVLREHRDSHAALRTALDAVPEAHLMDGEHAVLWLTPAIGHPRLHLADLRRALEDPDDLS
ncbi:MAG: maleylpyruvate isomerase N-terminal domain-containing protein [Candidatus Dormibacteria bacterium]